MKNGRVWSFGLLSLAAVGVAGGCVTVSASPTLPAPQANATSESTNKPATKSQVESVAKSPAKPSSNYTLLGTPPEPCPTGNCDPFGNGEGLYFSKDKNANYCLVNGPDHFFPEAFVNDEDGVVLVGRSHKGGAKADWKNPPSVVTKSVFVLPANGGAASRMVSLTTENGELAITYGEGGAEHASGKELEDLVIRVDDASGKSSTSLRLTLVDGGKHYKVKYGRTSGHLNQDLCDGENVSFVGGKRIEAGSGKVTLASAATTLSCQSGAIAKCTALGYAEPHAGVPAADVDRLFGSCLQGVRATYLAGQGDYTSYTKDGTQIFVNDPYIRMGEMKYIEALWTPQGPHCVNLDHLRLIPPQKVVDEMRKLPVCTGDLQPTNPVKLTTGPADQVSQPVALGTP